MWWVGPVVLGGRDVKPVGSRGLPYLVRAARRT